MKSTLGIVLVISALVATPAVAATALPAPNAIQSAGQPRCAANPLSRVAIGTSSSGCCTAALSCPQLLSNTGLVKTRRPNRT